MAPRVLITTVQVPFTRGGAEILVDGLKRELIARGFEADVVQVPFTAPKEALLRNVAIWRSLDLSTVNGKKVDLMIATKFPSYLPSHPCKAVWLVHQHRQMYELFGTHFSDFSVDAESEALRQLIEQAETKALQECSSVYTISENVSGRLKRYLNIDSAPLLPPLPLGSSYRSEPAEDYILCVGRICRIKRPDLLVKAMPKIDDSIKLKVVGVADEPEIEEYIHNEIDKHHLWKRIEFLGKVSDEVLLELYAKSFAVYYAPFDEDYGFVTLEAFASGKPVVTAQDSGGVLAFVKNEFNGLIVEPTEDAVAAAFNRLRRDVELYGKLSGNARRSSPRTSWDDVIGKLTSGIAG